MKDEQRPLPSYANPPVGEVVFGVQFAPLADLLAPHLGRFWARIVDDYPKIEEQPPIRHVIEDFGGQAPPEVVQIQVMSKPELPRCWFLDSEGARLIQVQRDRFVFNWRRTNPNQEYPRYPPLKARFLDHWAAFREFLSSEGLPVPPVDQCELTYVNHILRCLEWETMADFRDLFSFLGWAPRESFLPLPEDVRMAIRYRLPGNQGRLHAEISPARRKSDTAEIVRFTLTARGRPDGEMTDAAVSAWFDLAHEWITRGFVDMTGRGTDALWGRER